MRNAIVLACDNSYMDKLETTIKSICAHNKNIKFYMRIFQSNGFV